MKQTVIMILSLLAIVGTANAGDVDVVDVAVTRNDDIEDHYDFDVTLSHDDSGWQHYADKWEILGPNGKVYATRVLWHPHVNEQPFLRSLENVKIPSGVKNIMVRGHAKPHGYGGITKRVTLPE